MKIASLFRRPRNKGLLIALAGHRRSGKGRAAQILQKEFGAEVVRGDRLIIWYLNRFKNGDITRENKTNAFTMFHRIFLGNKNWLIWSGFRAIAKSQSKRVVFDNIRLLSAVSACRTIAWLLGREFVVVALDASVETRHRRAVEAAKRGEGKSDEANITLEQFVRAQSEDPNEGNLEELLALLEKKGIPTVVLDNEEDDPAKLYELVDWGLSSLENMIEQRVWRIP